MKKAIILLKDIITNIFKVLILGCLEVVKHVVNAIKIYWMHKRKIKIGSQTVGEFNDSVLEGCLLRWLLLVTLALLGLIYLVYQYQY